MAQNKQKKVDKKSNNISGRNIYLDRQGQTVYYDPISKCGYIIDKKVDSLRFYYLGNNYKTKVEHVGVDRGIAVDDTLIL